MGDLDGKVGVVTGAAQGTGLGITRRLAADGASIVMVDIDAEELQRAERSLVDEGLRVVAVHADVADPEAVEAFINTAVSTYGRLDILVNNAAAMGPETLARDSDVENVPFEVWERTFAVNLFGPMVACRFALPHLMESAGSIVNISTIGALRGRWNQVAYGVSKAGLNSLTEYVATTYGRRNVRCNTVAPGLVMTPMAGVNMSAEARAISASDRLIAREGTPEDIAGAVKFLVSADAAYITGQVLVVDGGTINHVPGYSSNAPGARVG